MGNFENYQACFAFTLEKFSPLANVFQTSLKYLVVLREKHLR